MNHASIIETRAAERYLLGELLPREREAFETHFFECPECAGDVYAGHLLAQGAHAFFSEAQVETATPIRHEPKTRWSSWFRFPGAVPAAAAFALLTFTVYQNAILYPALRRVAAESAMPMVLPSAVLVPAARSAVPAISVPPSAPFLQLSLTLPPTTTLGSYRCELHDNLGRVLWTMPVSVGPTADDINLLVPAGQLVAGTYKIVMRDGGRRAMDPFQFQLVRQ